MVLEKKVGIVKLHLNHVASTHQSWLHHAGAMNIPLRPFNIVQSCGPVTSDRDYSLALLLIEGKITRQKACQTL